MIPDHILSLEQSVDRILQWSNFFLAFYTLIDGVSRMRTGNDDDEKNGIGKHLSPVGMY